jgi:hypothetical protein
MALLVVVAPTGVDEAVVLEMGAALWGPSVVAHP